MRKLGEGGTIVSRTRRGEEGFARMNRAGGEGK